MQKQKITKEEALSFLLTVIVVEHTHQISLNPATLFAVSNLAQQAADEINDTEGSIPHEVIEMFATKFLEES